MDKMQQKKANDVASEIKAKSVNSTVYATISNAIWLQKQYQKQLPSSLIFVA